MPTLELLPDDEPSHPFLLNRDANKNDTDVNFNNLSEEEKSVLFDHVATEFAQDPKAMDRLAAQFLREVRKDDFHDVPVQPQPGYICKTKVIRADGSKAHCKTGTIVYINVCHADAIPAPPVMPESEVQKALHAEPDATFRIPVSLGNERHDDDSEKAALIYDACIHTLPYTRSERDLDFRLYILELCIELVEERLSVELSREFTMPNMASKGQIPKRILRLPKPALISAVRDRRKSSKKPSMTPSVTVNSEKNEVVVVVPNIPSVDPTSWTLDVEPNQLLLGGLGSQLMKIPLPQPVAVDHGSSDAQYYKRSRDLVIRLSLASAGNTRRQYL